MCKSRLLNLLLALTPLIGCGEIVDPDNIVVAELDGDPIRQGDLYKHLRRLPEADRPLIQTQADILKALNDYINQQVLQDHADQLSAANLIHVPREAAKAAYFQKSPEFARIYDIPDARLVDLSPADLEAVRAQVDFAIDDEQARLLREAALHYLAQQAVASGELTLSERDFETAYQQREKEMTRLEQIEFIGIRFPTSQPDAAAQAAAARRRVSAGESFDALVAEYRAKDPDLILESVFENDPASHRFDTFWQAASDSEPGDVLLAFLPPFTVVEERAGLMRDIEMPASHLLFKVIQHQPAGTMSLEEAKPALTQDLYLERTMQRLRDARGVRVFDEALTDPAGLGDQFKSSIIKTTVD